MTGSKNVISLKAEIHNQLKLLAPAFVGMTDWELLGVPLYVSQIKDHFEKKQIKSLLANSREELSTLIKVFGESPSGGWGLTKRVDNRYSSSEKLLPLKRVENES